MYLSVMTLEQRFSRRVISLWEQFHEQSTSRKAGRSWEELCSSGYNFQRSLKKLQIYSGSTRYQKFFVSQRAVTISDVRGKKICFSVFSQMTATEQLSSVCLWVFCFNFRRWYEETSFFSNCPRCNCKCWLFYRKISMQHDQPFRSRLNRSTAFLAAERLCWRSCWIIQQKKANYQQPPISLNKF